ncbi:MAG: type III pantothenate kinase [Humidesulfovibrio sp.]|uniref:type III pantothenate kinase n=1 Tax=Humidesulfovibrio sp. TaxID=2910988 RepID=UPI0027EF0D00|nr:type III pantothenate kinase [Humidesulfovibrio sp.]MDQ7836771.1 type III pantothenate kinase [Humidesulfovibrio sp.]
MDTVLLLDVGNTNVKIGLAQPGQGLVSTYALPTAPSGNVGTADSWGLKLLDICRVEGVDPGEIMGIVASSVVPPMNPVLTRAAARFFGQPGQNIRFVPDDIPLALENRYARPQEVGADRLVTAFSARASCQAHTLIVVDFGTATTFDCVQGNAYLGGLICPGVLSSARALATGTAKLPHITLEMDADEAAGCLHIGRSTSESLNQGLLFGFAAMVEGLVCRLAATLGVGPGDVHVIATGGFAKTIAGLCPAIDEVREDLLLDGLFLAWKTKR